MTRYSRTWIKLGLALALSGCSLSNEDVDDGDNVTPPPAHTLTIYDIRNPDSQYHPAEGTTVTLEGKVVTAVMPADSKGRVNFFISEPEGGEWSGIYVYDSTIMAPVVAVGDEVTVKGTYSEYKSSLAPETDLAVSEIGLAEVTVTGTADVPVFKFPSASLADIATGGSRAVSLESVLVEIDAPVQVVSIEDHGEFKAGTNANNSVRVDDSIFFNAEVGKAVTQALPLVRGILWYTYSDFKLEPRDADDLVAGDITYADATVYQLRDRSLADAIAVGYPVRLTDMVVTGATGSGTGNFFMQLPAEAWRTPGDASFSGIFGSRATNSANTALAVGDLVTVEGVYVESPTGVAIDQSLAQLNVTSVTKTGTTAVPAPVLMADPSTIATGGADVDKYESALVRVENVSVVKTSTATDGNGEVVVDGNLHIDDFLYPDIFKTLDPRLGKGPIYFVQGPLNFYGGYSKIEPRGASDVSAFTPVTVYDIRKQLVAAGTDYVVPNVVVTAVVGDGTGDFVVQVPTDQQDATLGATFSGMYCTRATGVTTQVAVGELVTIEGQYDAGDGTTYALTIFTASKIDADPDRTVAVPAPAVIADPTTIATGGADIAAYESVLVEVDAVSLVSENPDAVDGADYGEFTVTGDLRVDDMLFPSADVYGRKASTGFEYIKGVLFYDDVNAQSKLEPRSTADLKRNPLPLVDATVYQIQDPADLVPVVVGDQVRVTGVVVTAVVDPQGAFWVQIPDAAQDTRGAAYSGIFCDRGYDATSSAVAVGDEVTVVGQYTEETDLDPQLTALLVDATGVTVTGAGTGIVPTVVTIADPASLSAAVTAEQYEGVLVSIADVAANPDDPAVNGEVLVGIAGQANGVLVDDMMVADVATTLRRAVAGIESITGVLTQTGPVYELEPRAAGDVVVTAIPDQTIYDLQDPAESPVEGMPAKLSGVVVTWSLSSTGAFWAEIPDAARDTRGARFSGIYCERTAVAASPSLYSNNIVELEGTLSEVNGLSTFRVTKITKLTGTGTVSPALIADPSTIATGGADAEAYEGVLVQVDAVDVVNPTPDDPDIREFMVTGNLRVGSYVYADAAAVGRLAAAFDSVTGLLHFGGSEFKVEPRKVGDLAVTFAVTPYDLREVVYPDGVKVHIDGLVVTGVAGNGAFFAQLATPDTVKGVGNSGIYVYKAVAGSIAEGDIVSVEGGYKLYNGLHEITNTPTVTVVSSGNTVPDPVVVGDPSTIATGGADASRYQSILVRVENVAMVNATPDATDYKEFVVTGPLRVNDLLWAYDVTTLRAQTTFSSIQGPLDYANGNTKIEPRRAEDVVYP